MDTRNPSEWRSRLPVEAASGLNDWLDRSVDIFEISFAFIDPNYLAKSKYNNEKDWNPPNEIEIPNIAQSPKNGWMSPW
jgi:hypothetical protein